MSHKGVKRKHQESDIEGYLSDESAFYGDEATKHTLEKRIRSFNAQQWWANKPPSLITLAQENISQSSKPITTITPYNPYENCPSGRQLHESLEEFLARLPPATTTYTPETPWIYAANPFRQRPGRAHDGLKTEFKHEKSGGRDGMSEKEVEDQGVAALLRQGGRVLEEITGLRHQVEKENPKKAKATITKILNPRKEILVKKLLQTAVDCGVVSGKWMIFCDPTEVNAVWEYIARGTMKDELGIAAKVAPDNGEKRQMRLICVYTKDFTDMADVTRVAAKLRDYGVITGKGIYYKCDAYTWLQLGSGNEYGIKASLYGSAELLKAKGGTISGFFDKKKMKDETNWELLLYE